MIYLLTNHYKILTAVIVLFAAVTFQDTLQYYYSTYIKYNSNNNKVGTIFTAESLARYNGIQNRRLYIAVLGEIYDVSKSKQHYAKGSPYNYFVGKDGSRALVTGDFQNESENKDYVLDLTCSNFDSLLKWRDTLVEKYQKVGVLDGRYYDSRGEKTVSATEFDSKIKFCADEKRFQREQDTQYPPCNIAWSEDEGTKVWCTKSSGGIRRDWVGVPRQLYTPGDQKPKCVCLNTDGKQDSSMKFKEYENCANTSTVCYIHSR